MNDSSNGPQAADKLDYASPATARPVPRWLRWVEVLVCLLILAVPAAIMMPPSRGMRPEANAIACRAMMRSVGHAIHLYAADHGGVFPDTLTTLFPAYCTDARLLLCPASTDTPATGATTQAIVTDLTAGGHLSYVYTGAGLTSGTADKNTVILFEWPGHHAAMKVDGINVVFGDGHAEWITNYRPILDRFAAGISPIMFPSPAAPASTTSPASASTRSAGR